MYDRHKIVAALHIRGEKRKLLSVRSRLSAKQRPVAKLHKDLVYGTRVIGSDHRDRTDQDYEEYEGAGRQSHRRLESPSPFRGDFSYRFTSRRLGYVAFAPQVLSSKKKHREREREGTTNRKRNVCTEIGGAKNERQREERDGWVDALIVWYTGGLGSGKENDQKGSCDSTWLLSFSSHCSPLTLLFTFPVPRSPFSELHAPNPTSDPHKGRRGRNTFGKSSSTPL